MINGECILSNLAETLDRGCRKFKDGDCVECAERFYFGKDGHCTEVSGLCRKWNYMTG